MPLSPETNLTHLQARATCGQRRALYPGERLTLALNGLAGQQLGEQVLEIVAYAGSGFAGQVYCVRPESGALAASAPQLALKILRPASRFKEWLREALHWLSYSAPFAARLDEGSVRLGLLWQEALHRAAPAMLGQPDCVVRPLAYGWLPELGSYAELHEWVPGRAPAYPADDGLLVRYLKRHPTPPPDEMTALRGFMADLKRLIQQLGAVGLSRQYEWDTLVSPANVLIRSEPPDSSESGALRFCGVDWRVGLAAPVGLPLSPGHLRLGWQAFQRNERILFDQVDLHRWQTFTTEHSELFADAAWLPADLLQLEQESRLRRPDFWQRGWRLQRDPQRRAAVLAGELDGWERLGWVTPGEAAGLRRDSARLERLFWLRRLPLVGGGLARLWMSPAYRVHLRQLLGDPVYRRGALTGWHAARLLDWWCAGSLSPASLAALSAVPGWFLLLWLALGWLPDGLRRLLLDPAARREWLRRTLLHPWQLMTNPAYRAEWLANQLQAGAARRRIAPDVLQALQEQTRDPRLHNFVRDLGLTLALDLFARLLYLGLALYAAASGNFLPLLVAALGPLSPSGLVRVVYLSVGLLTQLARRSGRLPRRQFAARLVAIGLAPWRVLGNLASPVELFVVFPTLSLALAESTIASLVKRLPVLGGRGRVLEYWAFQALYNLPLSILRVLSG